MKFHRIVRREPERVPLWLIVAIYGSATALLTMLVMPALFGTGP